MNDLISRQAAIDAVANQSTMSPHDRVIAVDTLVALPSADTVPTIDIPIGVAIVVSEDGTVSRITGVKI